MYRIILFLGIILFSCDSARYATGVEVGENKARTSTGNANDLDLTYYLRQVAGVQVEGSGASAQVQIRGQASLSSETRPLFVLDGQKLGHDYGEVYALVTVTEIANIRILKNGDETSLYGLQGANGVIEIELKN